MKGFVHSPSWTCAIFQISSILSILPLVEPKLILNMTLKRPEACAWSLGKFQNSLNVSYIQRVKDKLQNYFIFIVHSSLCKCFSCSRCICLYIYIYMYISPAVESIYILWKRTEFLEPFHCVFWLRSNLLV